MPATVTLPTGGSGYIPESATTKNGYVPFVTEKVIVWLTDDEFWLPRAIAQLVLLAKPVSVNQIG
jgi:hypothetical protein